MREPSGSKGGSKRRPPEASATDAAADSGAAGTRRGLLALVATPIGNLGDISARALETLRGADVIACEDTRVTGNLLAKFGIRRPVLPYHDHNAERMRPQLLERLARGETVALVSDAGTPLISDPGYKLVRAAHEAGLAVTAIPGAAAPITALVLSGLPSDRFLFAGFLPPKSGARRATLAELRNVPATLLLFETGPRLAESLADCHQVLGDRPAAVARELTKLHEEVRRGMLSELSRHYHETGAPKGEIVLVIGPPDSSTEAPIDVDQALVDALARMGVKEAATAVAAASGLPRREIYARALALSGRRDAD
ncbi:MAG TPA: 16S rRNA (cytidine(1402)-2'-O)-methyltransferase [Dongiaceae bacterium]|nr:16S rRNA (cytidine(1402)-2'-O)-methyltransferase [Dongiaceae bacterium]